MRLDCAFLSAAPVAEIVASITATSCSLSSDAACLLPSARVTSASASACAEIFSASAMPRASIVAALARPSAIVSSCCASAAATAPLARQAISWSSAGLALMILMLMMPTPYRVVISFACATEHLSLSTSKSSEDTSLSTDLGSLRASTTPPSSPSASLMMSGVWPTCRAVAAENVFEKFTFPTSAESDASACLSTSLRSLSIVPASVFFPLLLLPT
mmetsp:Transcript_51410/g.115448  ORF Transcript_51410/g.115448 Transcript_51410/m.115448 type:complete len:217 (-) Transcript_51410:908-1558(-)